MSVFACTPVAAEACAACTVVAEEVAGACTVVAVEAVAACAAAEEAVAACAAAAVEAVAACTAVAAEVVAACTVVVEAAAETWADPYLAAGKAAERAPHPSAPHHLASGLILDSEMESLTVRLTFRMACPSFRQ